jgi:NADH-quinone oxidoreductase subunit N
MHNFIYLKFEFYLLFFLFYLSFLYVCTKFFKLKLNTLDFMYISSLFLLLLFQCALDDLDGSVNVYYLDNFFIFNDLIQFFKLSMVSFLFIYLVIIYNFNIIIKLPILEYLILIVLCFFSLVIMIISNHLFVIFLFLEVLNICLYCLIGLNKNSNKGIEAAFKYFIQSALATIIGFFAISIIYLFTGTLFINELIVLLNGVLLDPLIQFSIFILISVIFFKLGLFPFHSWVPDVYQGSYLIVALFVGTLPKFAYVFLFIKFFLIAPNDTLISYVLYISLLSVIYGTIISLYQVSLKRLLAYGSMVHMGFIIYSLTLNTPTSIAASIFYLLIYIVLIIFVFAFMFLFFEKNKDDVFFIDDISKLGNILNKNYLLSLTFSYILLSLAGLPFFIGFISKWYIFLSLLNKNYFIDLIILLIVSVVSAAYYIRIIRFIFFVSNKDNKVPFNTDIKLGKSFYILLIFLFILNLFIIFYHNWIFLYIFKCVLCLFSK